MQHTTTAPIRPTFLTVLCILTFLGSSMSIVSGIFSYLTADTASELTQVSIQDTRDKLDAAGDSKLAEKIMNDVQSSATSENLKKAGLSSIVSSVLTLLGAILMFRLKKTGFWLYVLGTAVSIVMPVLIYGAGNIMSMIGVLAAAFIGIVFVVLYGLNLKHLS